MSAMTFATQTEVQAWEQEIKPCEHTLCLEQDTAKALEAMSRFKLNQDDSMRLVANSLSGQNRPCTLFFMRTEGESLALSPVWKS